MADELPGLYRKFTVERANGSSGRGGKHEHCDYFVLDWIHDKFARVAALAYADACEAEYPDLAHDLRDRAAAVVAHETLKTMGFELGPGWKIGRGKGMIYVNPKTGYCAFPHEAETMGAIVRKAEAPTLPDQVHAFEPSRFGDYCGREVDGDYCKRGRAHEVHTVPAAAPAAPVGSLAEEVLRILHAFNSGDSRRDDVRALAARIAALEAELVEAKRRISLDAELFEEAGRQAEQAEKEQAAAAAAVQAERERCCWWARIPGLSAEQRYQRIKNGDPKP